jgi:hypothetical protein
MLIQGMIGAGLPFVINGLYDLLIVTPYILLENTYISKKVIKTLGTRHCRNLNVAES